MPSNSLPYQFFYAIEEQISERKSRERSERDYDRAVAQELVNSFYFTKKNPDLNQKFVFFQSKYEGNQWGRPGPGGPYWRERTVTGQGFFEKMVTYINHYNNHL